MLCLLKIINLSVKITKKIIMANIFGGLFSRVLRIRV